MTATIARRPWYQRPLIWFAAALIVALLAFFGPRVWRLPGLVRQAKTEAAYWNSLRSGGLKALSRAGAMDRVSAHLDATHTLVSQALSDWGFCLDAAPVFSWLPRIGGDLAALPHFVDAGAALLDGGTHLFQALKPGLARLPDGAGKVMASLATSVQAESASLSQASQAFQKASTAWAKVNTSRLSARLSEFVPMIEQALPALVSAPDLVQALPELLGADGPKRYLILAQNSDEIRATGGFISGVGVLELEQGEIKSLSFGDSYTIMDLTKPHPIPPTALETHMWAQILLFRDANWWADFPTSAQKAWELYEQDTGEIVDGIIAIDTPALQLLVGATGPVRLEEYGDTITADNLMERIQEYWASPAGGPDITSNTSKWWGLRKEFMGVLAKAVMERLLNDTSELDVAVLAQAGMRLLNERHLLLYFPAVEKVLSERKWDGGIVPTDGDYLFVVDSNVGFNKVNPVIQQAISYTIDLADSTATLQIRYTHASQARLDECVHESRYGDTYQDMMDRCYWNYIRVFVPAGAELLYREGLDDGGLAEPERDKDVLDGLLVLSPGETREVTFYYRLPHGAATGSAYHLYIQKQSGTWDIPLRITIRDGSRLLTEFSSALSTDQQFYLP